MKNNERQNRDAPALFREACQEKCEGNRAESAVQQVMVMTLVEVSGFSAQRGIRKIKREPESICIRQNSGERYEPAIAQVVGRFRAYNPTAKEMSQWGHASNLFSPLDSNATI